MPVRRSPWSEHRICRVCGFDSVRAVMAVFHGRYYSHCVCAVQHRGWEWVVGHGPDFAYKVARGVASEALATGSLFVPIRRRELAPPQEAQK
jgi:hypothetical protein